MGDPIALLTPPQTPRTAPNSSSWRQRLVACACTSVCLLGVVGAHAEIRFEDKSEGRGERFSMDVRDEPIADVIDELAKRHEFTVDGYPEHWSKDPMSFSATGDLERVLRSLLKDTSHVFEYHTDLATKETRIAKLNLLNEGVEGFIATTPKQQTTFTNDGGTVTPGTGNRQPGNLADRVSRQTTGNIDYGTQGSAPNSPANNAGPASTATQVSGISRSLEQRARQSAGVAPDAGSAQPTKAAAPTPVDPAAPSAEMQALTQKALQDVRGLAEALRKAENGSQ